MYILSLNMECEMAPFPNCKLLIYNVNFDVKLAVWPTK